MKRRNIGSVLRWGSFLAVWLASVAGVAVAADRRGMESPPMTPKNGGGRFEGESGPDHRLIRSAAQGRGSVVAIESGMHYWDGRQWSPSDARFELGADGSFTAEKVQTKVRLKANLNRTEAVTLTTSDGVVLKSTPLGIRLFDSVSGETMVIGTLRDCRGSRLSDHQVIYSDAFQGVCASVLYTLDKGSFQQDVVLTSQVNPADYGFPPDTTRIQVMTEFYDGNQPLKTIRPLYVEKDQRLRRKAAMPDLVDETLEFGALAFGAGRAFTGVPSREAEPVEAPVVKEFTTLEKRRFLIESVEYVSVKKGLQALPRCGEQTLVPRNRQNTRGMAMIPPALVPGEEATVVGQPAPQVASIPTGVTVDYIATVSAGTLGAKVFQGDTTYFVAGAVFCNGSTTIESGAVFKYPNSTGTYATPVNAYLTMNSGLTMKGTAYRPIYFTSGNDDTVGDKLSTAVWANYRVDGSGNGLVGTESYANPAIILSDSLSATTLSHCRFRYAQAGIRYSGAVGGSTASVNHSQFLNCLRAIELSGSGSSCCGTSFTMNMFNCLMSAVPTPIQTTSGAYYYTANLYNNTFDTSARLADGTLNGLTIYATNNIFAAIASTGTSVSAYGGYNGFYSSTFGAGSTFGNNTFSTATTPFQIVGGGSHYLLATSNFRNVANSGALSTTRQADLQARTTEGPVVLAVGAGQSSPLDITADRDTDGFDLGYHYDPLDYLVSQFAVPNSGAGTILKAGVAVGIYGNYGFSVPEGGTISGEGVPLMMNRLVGFMASQDQTVALNPSGTAVATPTTAGLFDVSTATSTSSSVVKPVISLRFTDLPAMGHIQNFFNATTYPMNLKTVTLKDCWLRGINLATATTTASGQNYLPSTAPSVTLWNNLLERTAVNFSQGYFTAANNPLDFDLLNNTVWYCSLTIVYNDTTATLHPGWVLQDNLFDNTSISFTGNGSYLTYVSRSYNGYAPATATTLGGTSDTTLTSVVYNSVSAVGWTWYVGSTPSVGTTDYDSTRTGAAAGLYHYTRSTSQTKETTSSLDIGFHYVALVSNKPADSDSDGIPDYLEDSNGDGTYAAGDISNWQNADTDSDGMPDGWEYTYGLNPLANDTSGDPDADGVTNLGEYQLGTNPIVDESQVAASRRNYTYDLLNRLISVTGKGKVTITYDKEGNIQTVTP
ncbi:MAG TPA: hypothetical protein VMF06_21185 [Candidatus Limnocylindria bacterium]|jgi:hypothetical protein|nr:hypothetical protein [Candidatus Limnocylindria bacterium]